MNRRSTLAPPPSTETIMSKQSQALKIEQALQLDQTWHMS